MAPHGRLSTLNFQTNFTSRLDNSSMALFDSLNVIDIHFRWMQEYGLDGVVIQRFLTEVQSSFDTVNAVLMSAINAAEKYGREFFIEYDISGASSEWNNQLLEDWKYIVNTVGILKSPSYIYHNDKPVIMIYGIGFSDNIFIAPNDSLFVINSLKDTPAYFIGGVPSHWRIGVDDSAPNFIDVDLSMDCLSPWLVGRFSDERGFDEMYRSTLAPDMLFLSFLNLSYAPVVWPGFSWTNLIANAHNATSSLNQIPRNGGRFWTHQVEAFISSRSKPLFLFGAMFDEYDEGTAMAKAASTLSELPVEGKFLYLSIDGETLPNDFYLTLAGKYTAIFANMTVRLP